MQVTVNPAGALAKKLGIKTSFRVRLINAPANYHSLVSGLHGNELFGQIPGPSKDFIHFFTKSKEELARRLPLLKAEMAPDGMIWVSWPKRASKESTDVTENVIREIALQNGLVDVKVCAVDELWSGLKLVIRIKDRPKV